MVVLSHKRIPRHPSHWFSLDQEITEVERELLKPEIEDVPETIFTHLTIVMLVLPIRISLHCLPVP